MTNLSRDYIRDYYQMPNLKKGLKVTYRGKTGKITGFVNSYIKIKTDDGLVNGNVHPQDEELEIMY
ncbi:MAG: hypothetical protein SCALA702_01870 [Melioribacteraceae bacterium]|nr:MAG: hypothetical protein SCALA702_01870 [Melioribacteraceae bacterium]